jgi:hypothetical protein
MSSVPHRILSTRVLSYGKDEVGWACLELSTCECTPEDLLGFTWDKKIPFRATLVTLGPDRMAFLYDAWYDIVRLYSRRSLTLEKVKFPAIADIALELKPLLRD